MEKKVVFNTVLCVWIRHYLYGCRSRSFHHQAKKTYFLLESWKSLTRRAGSGSGSVTQWHGSADPDPNQNVTDPQHCLKTIKYYQRKKAVQNLRNNNNVRNATNREQYGAVLKIWYMPHWTFVQCNVQLDRKKQKSTTNIECKIILLKIWRK